MAVHDLRNPMPDIRDLSEVIPDEIPGFVRRDIEWLRSMRKPITEERERENETSHLLKRGEGPKW